MRSDSQGRDRRVLKQQRRMVEETSRLAAQGKKDQKRSGAPMMAMAATVGQPLDYESEPEVVQVDSDSDSDMGDVMELVGDADEQDMSSDVEYLS